MNFSIHLPLTYVLIMLFFYIKKHGFINRVYYIIIFLPFLINILMFWLNETSSFDIISKDDVIEYLYSSSVTMIIVLIIYHIYRFIKKGNKSL